MFEYLTVFENLELALAGDKSFWNALFARLTAAQRERIDEVLETIGLDGTAARRWQARCRTDRSSGWRSACC